MDNSHNNDIISIPLIHTDGDYYNNASVRPASWRKRFIYLLFFSIIAIITLGICLILSVLYNDKTLDHYTAPENAFNFSNIFDMSPVGSYSGCKYFNETACLLLYNSKFTIYSVLDDNVNTFNYVSIGKLKSKCQKTELSIEAYSISTSGRFLLFNTDVQHQFRHSGIGYYFLYDSLDDTCTQFPDDKSMLRLVVWCENKEMHRFSFVDKHDLYVYDIETHQQVKITHNTNDFINEGFSDWIHEEEVLGSSLATWWSNEQCSSLVFGKFNGSASAGVPPFHLPLYSSMNPHDDSLNFPYPTPGDNLAIISLIVVHLDDFSSPISNELVLPKDLPYLSNVLWTSSTQFVYKTLHRHQNQADFYSCTLDESSTNCELLLTQDAAPNSWIDPHQPAKYISSLNVIFDLWNEVEDEGFRNIVQISLPSGSHNFLIPNIEFDILDFCGFISSSSSNFSLFLIAAPSPLSHQLIRYDFSNNQIVNVVPLTSGHSQSVSCSTSSISHYFTVTTTFPNDPPHIKIWSTLTSQPIFTFTENTEFKKVLKTKAMPKLSFFTFKNNNNDILYGYYLVPPNFDPSGSVKYPVLQTYYNGPYSTQVINSQHLGFEAYFASSLGIVVVCMDGRGTGARGMKFASQTYERLGILETEDQLSLVENWMSQQKWIDLKRIACYGWSFGGFMTLMLLSSNRNYYYKTGIAVAPVTNWLFYDAAYTERFMLSPHENPYGYGETSILNTSRLENLFSFEQKYHHSFLLIHGTADDNVHPSNSFNIQDALISNHIVFSSQMYPNDHHSINSKGRRYHLYNLWKDWLETHLIK